MKKANCINQTIGRNMGIKVSSSGHSEEVKGMREKVCIILENTYIVMSGMWVERRMLKAQLLRAPKE